MPDCFLYIYSYDSRFYSMKQMVRRDHYPFMMKAYSRLEAYNRYWYNTPMVWKMREDMQTRHNA